MNQLPPDHQSQRKQERAQQQSHQKDQPMHLLQWYRRSPLKAKVGLWSVFALLLLLVVSLGVRVLLPSSGPFRNAGVHISAAPVYYVSPSGNDANNGSAAHPFATITRAAYSSTAGTTIHVLPGVYTKPVYSYYSGTAQARITFISDVKWGAKIITSGVKTSWTNYGNYVDIQGFDITGDGVIGINDYGSYVHIIGNHAHNYANASCGAGAAGIDDSENNGNHGNQVIGNVVDHIGPPLTTYCNLDQGIYHSTPGGYIANNIVYNVSAFGIQTWHSASGITIANNLVFNCGQGGILIAANHTLADNFLVVNNIAVHNLHLGIYEYATTGTHNQFLNNLVYANPINLLLQHGTTVLGTLTVDPLFVNYQADGSGDYHLSANSPAIGAGTTVGAPTTDMGGTTRVGRIDLGPYAYGVRQSIPARPVRIRHSG